MPDPILELVQKRKSAKSRILMQEQMARTSAMGPGFYPVPQDDLVNSQFELDTLDGEIKNLGYDPNNLENLIGDLPFNTPTDKISDILNSKDPIEQKRKKGSTAWNMILYNSINNIEDDQLRQKGLEEYGILANAYYKSKDNSYTSNYNTIRAVKDAIYAAPLTTEDRDAAMKGLMDDAPYGMAKMVLLDQSAQKRWADMGLNPMQGLALDYKTIFNPGGDEFAKSITQAMSQGKAQKEQQIRLAELENEGINILGEEVGYLLERKGSSIKEADDYYKSKQNRLKELTQQIKQDANVSEEMKARFEGFQNEYEDTMLGFVINEDGTRAGVGAYTFDALKEKIDNKTATPIEIKEYNRIATRLNDISSRYQNEFSQYTKKVGSQNAAVREYNEIVNSIKEPFKGVGDYQNLDAWADYLAQKKSTQAERFPEYTSINLQQVTQDVIGARIGAGKRFVGGLVANTGGELYQGVNRFWDWLTAGSDEELREDKMSDAYDRRINDVLNFYETKDQALKERAVIPVIPKDVEDQLKAIDNDSTLSDQQKYDRKQNLVFRAYYDKKISFAANPKYGNYNITSASVINTAVSVSTQLIGQLILAYASGGVSNVSKARQLTTLFGTTFAQTFARNYDQAVIEGKSNPFAIAFTNSGIEALSELPFNNLEFVNKLMPGAKKFTGELTEQQWKALISRKTPSVAGKELAKAGETIAIEGVLEEGLAGFGTNIADKYLFNGDSSITKDLDTQILAGVIGFAPLTALGLPLKYRSTSMGDKMLLYQAGHQADKVIQSLNEQRESGVITERESIERIEAVKEMKSVIEKMPLYDVNGKPLSDYQKAQYAWNEYVKAKSANAENLPAQQQEELNTLRQEADQNSSNILNGTEDATPKSNVQQQEGRTESNIGQPQGIGQGQQEAGQGEGTERQGEIPQANVGYSDISGQEIEINETPQSLTGIATKVMNDAFQTAKSLASAGVKVRVFQNQADFERESQKLGQQARGQGVFVSDGKNILINLSKIKDANDWGIVWHEGAHPVMNIIRNTNPELYNRMAQGFGGLAKQGGVFAQVQGWANADYGNNTDSSTDEAMVETVSLLGDGKIRLQDIPTSLRQQVIDFVNQIAEFLGLGQLADTSERVFIQKAAQIANTLRSGEDIATVVGAENVGMTQNPFAQKRDQITLQLRDRSSFDFLQGDALSVQSENPNNIYNAIKFADESGFDKNIDFKLALQERFNTHLKELKKAYGKDFEPLQYNEAVKKFYVDAIREEAKKGIQDHPEAIGWYDEKTRNALSIISLIHPEIATNIDDRAAFILPLAITSNGNLVDKNFEYALDQYEYFKANKRYNAKGEFGAQQSGIIASLNLMNAILDAGISMEDLTDYFTTMHKAGNLKFKIKSGGKSKDVDLSGGELVDEDVFGASILGPKIGNGFYMNLWGEFNQLTMDRWFMRTWGRLGGTLIDYDKGLVNENKKRLSDALSAIKSDPEAKKILKDVVGSTSGMSVTDLANTIKKISADKVSRSKLTNNPLTNELRKASNTLVGNMLGEVELPRHGTERKFIREVFLDVQKKLKLEDNIDITIADLQAVLWYPEKILYDSFQKNKTFEQNAARYQEGSAPDYQNAAADLARGRGYTDVQIQDSIRRGQSVRFSDTRGDAGISQADRTQNKERIFGVVKDFKSKNEVSQERNSSVFAAPFYDLSLRDQPGNFTTKADEARGTEAYQQYENDIKEVAQLLGINLEDVENLIGGFENEQGKKIVEVAAKSNIEVDDFNKAIQFAAILGAISPETQESTIAARYVQNGTPEHNADEYTLTVSNPDAAIKALTDIGVYNFSVNESTKEVTLLNIFKYPTENIDNILDNFASKLDEYGVQYTPRTKSALQSEYIDYNRRQEIITALQGDAVYQQGGQRLRDVIDNAKQRNEEFVKRKQGQERRSSPLTSVIKGFYSPIEDRINVFKQPKASAQKWKDIVGIKSDEAIYSGLADWLNSQDPTKQLSKEEVLRFMKDNRIQITEKIKGGDYEVFDENTGNVIAYFETMREAEDFVADSREDDKNYEINEPPGYLSTRYSEYQLPGGQNYKEILITLPNAVQFQSSHFNEPNIIAHLRMNTRTDANGKKVLFLEEVQSDWGQEGKKSGFKRGLKESEIKQIESLENKKQSILDGLNSYRLLKEIAGDVLSGYNNFYEKDPVHGFLNIIEGNISRTIDNPYYDPNDSDGVERGKKRIVEEVKNAANYWSRNQEKKINLSDQNILDLIDAYNEDAKGGRVKKPEGYDTNRKVLSPFVEFNNIENQIFSIENNTRKGRTESAPYVTDTNAWVKLGLKVALKEAIAQGADRIAWTTGEQQNERYDLSKSIKRVDFIRIGEDRYKYEALGLDGGRIAYDNNGTTSLQEIEIMFGKDIAEKVKADKSGDLRLQGDGLKVGGKGMKAFYGDAQNPGIVANVAKALVKDLTGKEGDIVSSKINVGDENADYFWSISSDGTNFVDYKGERKEFGTEAEAKSYVDSIKKGASLQPAIEVTKELASSAREGMPQFKNSSVAIVNDAIQNRKSASKISSKAIESLKDQIVKLGYGYLPEDVNERLKKKQRLIDADINEMNVLNKRFENAVREFYGVKYKDVPQEQKEQLDLALRNFEGIVNQQEKERLRNIIPDNVLSIIDEMRYTIDSFSKKLVDLGIMDSSLEPSFDADKGLGVYLTRTYRKYDDPEWVKNVPELVRARAKSYLAINNTVKELDAQGNVVERPLTDEELDGLVNYIASNTDPVMEGLGSANTGKANVDILKGRKVIPQEIRDLMGEYKDPSVNFARSTAKMATLIHTHQALKDIASENMGTLFFREPQGEYFVPVAGKDATALQPLSGLYSTREIAEAFKEVQATLEGDDWNLLTLRALAWINGVAKIGKTALSPASWVRNVIGGHIIMIKDGHIGGTGYAEGWKKALGYFANKDKNDPAFQEKVREYIENGIMGDGVAAGEFQAIVKAAYGADNPLEYIKSDTALGRFTSGVKGFYSAQDDIFRIWAYENEKARLIKRKPNMSEAEVQAEASRKARATYPTYSELPEVVRKLAKFIPISSFPAFSAELIRTTKNSVQIAIEEMKDPDMRDVGIKRMAGVITAISFGSIVSGISSMIVGVGDDEEKSLRRFLPEWSRNSQLIWLGRDENGMPRYIDLGFSDPFSYFKKPFVAFTSDKDNISDRAKDAVKEATAPFVSPEIFISALVKGNKIVNESDDMDEVIGKYAGPIYESLEPGLLASGRRILKGLTGEVDRYGQQYDAGLESTAFFTGQRIKKFDPSVGFSFKAKEFNKRRMESLDAYYGEKSKSVKDEDAMQEELTGAEEKFKEYYSEFKKDYDAAVYLMSTSMPTAQVKKTLDATMKDRNVPEMFRNAIKKDKPYPGIMKKD